MTGKLAFSAAPEQSRDGVGSQPVTCSGIQTTGKRVGLPVALQRGGFTPATPRPYFQRTFRSLSHARTHTCASEPRPDYCGWRYVPESSITGGSLQPNLVCPHVQGTAGGRTGHAGNPRRVWRDINHAGRRPLGQGCGFRKGEPAAAGSPGFSDLSRSETRSSWRERRGAASGAGAEERPPWGSWEGSATCLSLSARLKIPFPTIASARFPSLKVRSVLFMLRFGIFPHFGLQLFEAEPQTAAQAFPPETAVVRRSAAVPTLPTPTPSRSSAPPAGREIQAVAEQRETEQQKKAEESPGIFTPAPLTFL